MAYTNKVHFLCNGKCVKNCHKKSARRATDKEELIYFPMWVGGGGGTLIFSCIRRLGSFLGLKILNFNIFFGFSEK